MSGAKHMAVRAATIASCLAATTACSAPPGDDLVPPAPGAGRDPERTVQATMDPTRPNHPASKTQVNVTDAVVIHQDTFDEVGNGSSRGTIYVQDLDSAAPYSGISLFAPVFVPANLRVAPGDVLNLSGEYQENTSIGTAVFPEGHVLSQLARPKATFRYEYKLPDPVDIDAADLKDFAVGRRWMGMLVRVKNVTLGPPREDNSRRVTYPITDDTTRNGPVMSNEFFPLKKDTFTQGTQLKELVGVVTYFFNLKVAPRSASDIVL
jgi:hypothetical protein